MNTINITVSNLIATAAEGSVIVSDNTGYCLQFAFDEGWEDYPLKTAVFVWYRGSLPYCQTAAFTGDTVTVPRLGAIRNLYVGVTAGDLQTTTPARIPCSHSILSSGGAEPEAPTESEYAQLMALINDTLWDKLNKSGASAYELAVENGYEGSEEAWLASLRGSDGYTPVRGQDYWTEEDQAAIQAECNALLVEELANRSQLKPEFANSLADCTDTAKLYVLPDGYIYGYLKKTSAAAGDYTNLADPGSSDWLTDQRMNSSGGGTACAASLVTNYIAVSPGDVVRVQGLDVVTALTNYANTPKQAVYNADKGVLSVDAAASGGNYWAYEADGDIAVFTVNYSTAAYMRFSGELADGCSASDVVITVNEAITAGDVTTSYQWASTGHAFVPADYEDRILDVEALAAGNAEAVEELETAVAALEAGSVTLPDYWQEAVEAAITKVKALQDEGGSETVQFLLFSDLHYGDNKARTQYVGKLCAAVMDACRIPLALSCGDTLTSAPLETEEAVLECLEEAQALLSPIGSRLLQIRGNHDDVWGSYTGEDATVYYVNKVAPAKIWNRLHRGQAADLRRAFGGDGTYFYLDNVPQKVRFICLNSHFYDGEGTQEGTAKNMTTGFGAAQLQWLEQAALDLPEGWSAVLAVHVPPTAESVNGSTYYLGQYSDGAAFRSIVSTKADSILGIFCGHCHADAIVSGDLPCPIITVTTAGGTPYDSAEPARTAGTDTETALDVVSIHKAQRTIHLTRIGVGSDRSCSC